jgi:hypothetical protein
MTDEEVKLLKKQLKKNEENGKVQKRGKVKETPYQSPEEASSGASFQNSCALFQIIAPSSVHSLTINGGQSYFVC